MVPPLGQAIQIKGKLMGCYYSWEDQEGKEECVACPEEVESWDRNLRNGKERLEQIWWQGELSKSFLLRRNLQVWLQPAVVKNPSRIDATTSTEGNFFCFFSVRFFLSFIPAEGDGFSRLLPLLPQKHCYPSTSWQWCNYVPREPCLQVAVWVNLLSVSQSGCALWWLQTVLLPTRYLFQIFLLGPTGETTGWMPT